MTRRNQPSNPTPPQPAVGVDLLPPPGLAPLAVKPPRERVRPGPGRVVEATQLTQLEPLHSGIDLADAPFPGADRMQVSCQLHTGRITAGIRFPQGLTEVALEDLNEEQARELMDDPYLGTKFMGVRVRG